jgi:hypothetical protein
LDTANVDTTKQIPIIVEHLRWQYPEVVDVVMEMLNSFSKKNEGS